MNSLDAVQCHHLDRLQQIPFPVGLCKRRNRFRPTECLFDIPVSSSHELLQDHQFTPDVTRHLRKMKAARQIEAVELMIAANTITAAHADALLKATPPEQRTDYTPPKAEEPKGKTPALPGIYFPVL